MTIYHDFHAALFLWHIEHPSSLGWTEKDKTIYALWWFIENVPHSNEYCTPIFFELKKMVYDTLYGQGRKK